MPKANGCTSDEMPDLVPGDPPARAAIGRKLLDHAANTVSEFRDFVWWTRMPVDIGISVVGLFDEVVEKMRVPYAVDRMLLLGARTCRMMTHQCSTASSLTRLLSDACKHLSGRVAPFQPGLSVDWIFFAPIQL